MSNTRTEFYHSETDEQSHVIRCREIMKKHPEVANLIGRNPYTALIMVFLLTLQFSLAIWLGKMGTEYWWLTLIVAYIIGAFANHNLYVVVHEATHNMIFKNRLANRWVCLLSDTANGLPGALGFSTYHLRHHAHLGDYAIDTDIATKWEAKLIGNSTWRKALWLFLFPVFQIFRTFRIENVNTWNKWVLINIALVVVVDVAVVMLIGPMALMYLIASMFFALGFHPLGARWVQEHYTLDGKQETHSYYGPMNKISMYIGYHVEHHDFPAIPWHNLPKLREIAPEYYNNLHAHHSWSKLWLDFIFNSKYSLFSRIVKVDGKDQVVMEIQKMSKVAR